MSMKAGDDDNLDNMVENSILRETENEVIGNIITTTVSIDKQADMEFSTDYLPI
jgi:hypothetical protein